ncbi:protein SOB FIVE-LIKE 5-like [Salvia splendens]|uniref:protein SOB FIVE-LIKE 5-like n=1 Tax=Salvia splendens TaxID=180675 RepID=UPI001C27AA21|nr:protein SOB FIVE-LIKE 5-like [Salvia splendens]
MNTSTSECNSGCESGWTTYLDHLSSSTNPYTHYTHQDYQGKGANYVHDHDHDQEADEDLSMVSDASSGPPHLHGPPPPQQDRKQKSKTKEKKNKKLQQHSFCLDDTASSPFLQGNAVPPENQHHSFSTAQFEEERMPKTKMGFFKSSGSLLGRKRQ